VAKRKSYNISIAKPCREKLGKTIGDGRHCSKCDTIVVDFSNYTDKELIAFLQKTPHGCGNFAQHQLDRPLVLPVENSNSFLHKALFGTALLAGIAGTSEGQSTQQSVPPVQVTIPNIPSTGENRQKETSGGDSTQTLRGFVYDSKTNEPISGVNIYIHINNKEYQTSTTPNDSGIFSINLPPNSQGKKLQLNFVGYFYKEHKVKTTVNNQTDLKVALKRNHKKHHTRGKF
jgi:hypothetical protein